MRTRKYTVPLFTHRLAKFSTAVKNASSPTPETEVVVAFGSVDDFAPAYIFALCIETVTTTLDAPVPFQLQPVVAMGTPAPTLTPSTELTWFCVSKEHGAV